jgi:hypothetical protein
MPVYLFLAQTHDPQTRQPLPPLPVRALERFVLYFPGDVQQAIQYAKHNGLGQWTLRQYMCYALTQENPNPVLLCYQPVLPAQTSAQHVQGGQPTGPPAAQPGQQVTDGKLDELQFQKLGTGALSQAQDPMFGDTGDGTYTDLYQSPAGAVEVPRDGQG